MPRTLETATLDAAARYYAGLFTMDAGRFDRKWVMGQFYNFTYKDEFNYLAEVIRDELGKNPRNDFDARIKKLMADKPRDPKVFEALLADKQAITLAGEHIEGKIGSVQRHGRRLIGEHFIEVEPTESILRRKRLGLDKSHRVVVLKKTRLYWPIYAGEPEERVRPGYGVADELPDGTPGLPVGAQVFNMDVATAILGIDAILNNLDAGSSNASIRGLTGAQPADPDVGETGTLLFSCAMTDPAFPTAVDQADGTVDATASSISDDVSANDTLTLGYCRVVTTNDGITPIDDIIDGKAETSGGDFNFNTLAIVSGATVSIGPYVVTLSQGSTAT